MNIAFTFNVKNVDTYDLNYDQVDLDFDSPEVIDGVEATIKSLGHKVIRIEADNNAFENLKANKNKIDLVFNMSEGLRGDARESQIPLFCEMLEIPYTHSNPTTHAIKINKQLCKMIVESAGIKVPKAKVVTKYSDDILKGLKFPLIVKPNTQGSSKGIFDDSVVSNKDDLKKMVNRVLKKFDREAVVEEYIDGREFTVGVLGTPLKVLPIIEQRFDFLPKGFKKIAGYELKWIYEDQLKSMEDGYVCPAKVTSKQKKEIEEATLKICEVLNVKDCSRIDYRMDKNGNLYFLEINTVPGIIPATNTISYFPLAARIGGIKYKQLLDTIIKSAVKRYKL